MSLEHHIVTPLTAMVIESEAGDERLLADSPPQDHSCCSGQCVRPVGRREASALTTRIQVLDRGGRSSRTPPPPTSSPSGSSPVSLCEAPSVRLF